MNHFKFSFIIPHFNSEESLFKLIDTIPDRNDIQIIIVDDISDKDSFTSVSHFLENSTYCSSIKLLSNTHAKGAGVSRNVGLSASSGKYVIFCDADDYLISENFNELEKNLNEYTDIYFTRPTSIDVSTGKMSDRHIDLSDLVILNSKYIGTEYLVPWGKVFRGDFLREKRIIWFDATRVANDVMFSVRAFNLAKEVELLNLCFYCVTKRETGLTQNNKSADLRTRLEVTLKKINYVIDNDLPHRKNSMIGLLYKYNKVITFRQFLIILRMSMLKKVRFF